MPRDVRELLSKSLSDSARRALGPPTTPIRFVTFVWTRCYIPSLALGRQAPACSELAPASPARAASSDASYVAPMICCYGGPGRTPG